MIVVDRVWKSFAGRPALRGASLRVEEGEAVLLSGPSGAGKTTLLRLLCLLERPDRGEISIAGRALGRLRTSSIPYVRRNLGVMFQDLRLLQERTVYENVAMAVEILGLPARQVRARAGLVLEATDLAGEEAALVRELPAGMQRRVALARALCADPAVLLCDEPTSDMDRQQAGALLGLLAAAHQRGTTLIVATHDPAVMAYGASRRWSVVTLVGGEVAAPALPAPEPRALVSAVALRTEAAEVELEPEDISIEMEAAPPGHAEREQHL